MSDTDTLDKPKTAPPAAPPEPRLPVLLGGGGIKAIIPQNFEEGYKMARIIAASGTAPKSYMMKDPTDLKEYLSVERNAGPRGRAAPDAGGPGHCRNQRHANGLCRRPGCPGGSLGAARG